MAIGIKICRSCQLLNKEKSMLHSVIRLHVLKKKVIGVLLVAAFITSGCATTSSVTKFEELVLGLTPPPVVFYLSALLSVEDF